MVTFEHPERMVQKFSDTQRGLVSRLLASVRIRDQEYFSDLPDGLVDFEEERWSYRRHGAGVAFRSTRGVLIDAHVAMVDLPGAVDAWRLYLYFDSVGVQELAYCGRAFVIDGETHVQELLEKMEALGVVRAVKHEHHPSRVFYTPASTRVISS
jgi:hypothetical protein